MMKKLILLLAVCALPMLMSAQDVNTAELEKQQTIEQFDTTNIIEFDDFLTITGPIADQFTEVIMDMMSKSAEVLKSSDITKEMKDVQEALMQMLQKFSDDEELQSKFRDLEMMIDKESRKI